MIVVDQIYSILYSEMATLDDRLLGEKKHYYCSSSSSSEDEADDTANETSEVPSVKRSNGVPENAHEWSGSSSNTGPKGVLTDFRQFKQLQSQRLASEECEKLALAKKLSMAVDPDAVESKESKDDLDNEMNQLMYESDAFLREYMAKAMTEMAAKSQPDKKFGKAINVTNGSAFLREIEAEAKSNITVICHVYCNRIPKCRVVNSAIDELAKKHLNVKFITLEVASAGLSQQFEEKGCPAILIYKKGSLIGNFVRISDILADDMENEDVEAFLVEHGFLTDVTCVPELMCNSKFRDGYTDANQSSDDE